MQAFCFCGNVDEKDINSIERIHPEIEAQWSTLTVNDKVPAVSNIAAVSYLNQILVFGALSDENKMLCFNEEGDLERVSS